MTSPKHPEPRLEPMVSANEIARLLGVSGRWVRDRAEDGTLPCYRIGPHTVRFRVSEVLATLERRGPDVGDDA